jgi:hypothetical protein
MISDRRSLVIGIGCPQYEQVLMEVVCFFDYAVDLAHDLALGLVQAILSIEQLLS